MICWAAAKEADSRRRKAAAGSSTDRAVLLAIALSCSEVAAGLTYGYSDFKHARDDQAVGTFELCFVQLSACRILQLRVTHRQK